MAESAGKAEVATPQTTSNIWTLTVVCVLGWIIPGLGHFLLKRYKKGIIFMILIPFLFFWGLNLGAKLYQYQTNQPLTFFALIAQAGMGLPYFIVRLAASYARLNPGSPFYSFAENFRFGDGNVENLTYEYGNTFAIVAGLLNLLVILDAHDIAVGRKKA